ncbi:MAG: hypothetical protein GY854_30670 [Deltaproteobacteria bacterium]|nr:hypothetical protein [Deltaproteobacteria bacterium]
MRRLFFTLLRFVTALWRADRVRVSRVDGQLRRLFMGGLVVVDGESFRVVDRKVANQSGEPCLEYSLSGPGTSASLRVFSHRHGIGELVLWRSGAGWQMFHPSQVAVFNPGRAVGRRDDQDF